MRAITTCIRVDQQIKGLFCDNPCASGPISTDGAALILPVEIPFRYNRGNAASFDFVFLA